MDVAKPMAIGINVVTTLVLHITALLITRGNVMSVKKKMS
jgi:hypothetical protein